MVYNNFILNLFQYNIQFINKGYVFVQSHAYLNVQRTRSFLISMGAMLVMFFIVFILFSFMAKSRF